MILARKWQNPRRHATIASQDIGPDFVPVSPVPVSSLNRPGSSIRLSRMSTYLEYLWEVQCSFFFCHQLCLDEFPMEQIEDLGWELFLGWKATAWMLGSGLFYSRRAD